MKDLTVDRKEIWSKGRIVTGLNPDQYRRDDLGHLMQYDKFQTDDVLGWDIEERYTNRSNDPQISPRAQMRFKSLFKDVDDYVAEKRREMDKRKPEK